MKISLSPVRVGYVPALGGYYAMIVKHVRLTILVRLWKIAANVLSAQYVTVTR